MFVTLTPLQREEPNGILARIRREVLDKIRPPLPTAERIELLGSFFTDIRVFSPSGGLPDQLELPFRLSCRLALCPDGSPVPLGFRPAVKIQEIRLLQANILCNTAVHVLQVSNLPLYCRTVGLIDLQGDYPHLLEKLIRYAPEVLVFTENDALYQGYAEKMMDEYGAPVTFVETPQALGRAVLTVCVNDTALPGLYPQPVLTPEPLQEPGQNLVVNQFDFGLPLAEEVIPPGIDKTWFYTALRQRCGIKEIDRLHAKSAVCGSRRVSIQDICSQILQNNVKSLYVK